MKRMLSLAALLFLLLLPAGCGITSNAQELPPEVQETLEDLCGADYRSYIISTITMQMMGRTARRDSASFSFSFTRVVCKMPVLPFFPVFSYLFYYNIN